MKQFILTFLACVVGILCYCQNKLYYPSNRSSIQYGSNTFINGTGYQTRQTDLINYCRNNGITYVLFIGLNDEMGQRVFNTNNGTVNDTNAIKFSNLVLALKANGVEEIGVGYESREMVTAFGNYDLITFRVIKGLIGIDFYNSSIRYPGKIDIISSQDEFWTEDENWCKTCYCDSSAIPQEYKDSCYASLHSKKYLNQLKWMVYADSICNKYPQNYLRTEIYLGRLDKDTIEDIQQVQEITAVVDRIQFAQYNRFINQVLRSDYVERLNFYSTYAVKQFEYWPGFDPSINPSGTNNSQGTILQTDPLYNTVDKIERKFYNNYYDSLNNGKLQIPQKHYLAGVYWDDLEDLRQWTTKAHPTVRLGRHKEVFGPLCSVVLTARVDSGATGTSYKYTWYNITGGEISSTTSTAKINNLSLSYPVNGMYTVKVEYKNGADTVRLTDYILVYSAYFGLPCISRSNIDHKPEDERVIQSEIESSESTSIAGSVGTNSKLFTVLINVEQVKIRLNRAGYNEVSVYNTAGQSVYNMKGYPALDLTMPNLTSGLYMVVVQNGTDRQIEKFIK